MQSANDKAARLVKAIGGHRSHLANMSDHKTLYVYGTPKEMTDINGEEHWPCEKGACFFVASYAAKAATERGCGKIVVDRGRLHRHEFDTADVIAACERRARGYLKKHKWNTVNIGQTTHRAYGSEFDTTRPNWRVPIAVSGSSSG